MIADRVSGTDSSGCAGASAGACLGQCAAGLFRSAPYSMSMAGAIVMDALSRAYIADAVAVRCAMYQVACRTAGGNTSGRSQAQLLLILRL